MSNFLAHGRSQDIGCGKVLLKRKQQRKDLKSIYNIGGKKKNARWFNLSSFDHLNYKRFENKKGVAVVDRRGKLKNPIWSYFLSSKRSSD